MFRTLGAFTYRHRWAVVGLWMVILAVGVIAQGPLSERVSAEFGGSDRPESARVLHRIEETSAGHDEAARRLELVGSGPLRRFHQRFGLHEPPSSTQPDHDLVEVASPEKDQQLVGV